MIHKCGGCGKTQDCEGRGDYCSECLTRIVDEYDALVAERDEWRNMVAVLCGDGGHYHAEHGTAATRAYIEKKLFDLREQVAGLKLAMEWLDPVCDPKCYDQRTPEGMAVHDKLVALLAEAEGE